MDAKCENSPKAYFPSLLFEADLSFDPPNPRLMNLGSEDVSLNVPLNNKGPLIGYFGENWSDADVIRSDMMIQDLALTDNPYRTDVHDGYER